MKLKSRGLGKRELVIDLKDCEIKSENGELVLSGTVQRPVTWEFSIRVSQDDIPGMLKVAMRPKVWKLGFRWFFHLKNKSVELEPEVQVVEKRVPRLRAMAEPQKEVVDA